MDDWSEPETNSVDGWQEAMGKFVVLWAMVDPIGTVPVFISATAERTVAER